MKSQVVTTGIVLIRRDFQEADRIITVLTPDYGKVGMIAKGVRRPNSKLAGGIELFSVSNITYLPGRGELSTLVSSRLITHYSNIVKDIQRTMLGYDLLKRLNRATEDNTGPEYFTILQNSLEGLNDLGLAPEITELWFTMQILKFSGHAPNLRTDIKGDKLDESTNYLFDIDEMAFKEQKNGPHNAKHIKLLRLASGTETPLILKQVKDAASAASEVLQLAKLILGYSVRI
jgi:DNA repair protein RecO (recombination protein O)